MICSSCKASNTESAKFCSHCGALLPKRDPAKQSRYGMALICGLLVLALAVLLFSRWKEETPSDIVKAQLKAIQNGQLTEAYYAFTSKEFQAATSLDDFKRFIKMFPTISESNGETLEPPLDQNDLKIIKGVFKGSNGDLLTIQYQLLKQDGHWKILNVKAIPNLQEGDAEALRGLHVEILKPIETQLKAIDAGDIQDAYDNTTTQSFKKITTFDAFKLFLSNFSILTIFNDFQILDISSGKDNAIVKFRFTNPVLKADVDYTVSKEDGKWLVRGIQIVSQESLPHAMPDFNLEEVLKPLQMQLKAIREGDFKKGYEEYTSQAFRKATSQEDFNGFLKRYPVFFQNHSADFYKLSFNNNVGIYNARLTANSGEEREVEYAVIKEDGAWKILQIQILNTSETKP